MIIDYDICEMLDDKMMNYSAYVILHRALPALEDGLKVSLRRILYTMHKEKMTNLTKSANISGQVMKIHAHGDSYPTIVNMIQEDNHTNPFIIGKGAFAYHTSRDTQPASSRYTEAKIAPYSQEMMEGLKKNSVEMLPTFDGSGVEPSVLPVKHPNILTHSQSGIAVGLATNFPSFNLSEVCDYTVSYLKGLETKDLIPDFATGGEIVLNKIQIKNINSTGRGHVDIRAKYSVDGDCILIEEIPYTTTREAIIEKIIYLVRSSKLKEIVDVKDTTDLRGMEIEIKVRKNTNVDLLMRKLYMQTPLQSSFSANMNCLVDNHPRVLGVKPIVKRWLGFRKECLQRELQFEINGVKVEVNKQKGLQIILSDLDKAISLIRSSKSENEAVKSLTLHFGLNQAQVEYISTIKLFNMNKEWLHNRTSRLEEITHDLKLMECNLNSDEYYNQTIISQLQEIKSKHGKPRRTEIICEFEIEDVAEVDLIEDYNCQIVLSKDKYIKKTLRFSDVQKVKDGDAITQQIQSTNKSKLLLFTDKSNCYYLNVHELDTTLPSNLGDYLPTLLQLQDEQILYVVSTEDYKGYMLFAFENGKVAKVNLSSYETKTNRTRVINAYNSNSKLVSMYYIEEDCDFIATSSIDKILIFDTSLINPKRSKTSQGVNVLKSRDCSAMIGFKPYTIEDEDTRDYYKVNIPAMGKFNRGDM